MALRNASRLKLKNFRGLNSYIKLENIPPDWWVTSINMHVNENGSAETVRPPKSFHTALTDGFPVLSLADFRSISTHKLLFDIKHAVNDMRTYTINDDYTNASIRTGQKVYPFISAVSGTVLFRVNQDEFVQLQEDATTFYRVGIDGPAAAPTIAYSGSGAGPDLIADGVQVSYAYYNSDTGHVSIPSDDSNRLAASGASSKIDVPTVASVQTGVDKIVFFVTEDGGAIPYLLIDSNGDPVTVTNATATNQLTISTLAWDTLTPEPIFNEAPPLGAQFMFVWKDRVFLLDFVSGSTVLPSTCAYSGYESCYIGIPGESWPTLNRISVPNKGEILKGGIGTQVGALLLSDVDAYLISGYPTDKTSGPEATTSVSEHLDPLHWNVGTKSARTIRNTPFGTIWLDQAQRLRLWDGQGFPDEIGLPLRSELALLDGTLLQNCEGTWFQMGQSGGVYIMVGTLASGAQRAFIVTIYQDPETNERKTGFAISSLAGYSLCTVQVISKLRLFMGGINQVFEIFYVTPETDGWTEGTKAWPGGSELYFDIVLGNDDNFGYWHSLSFDADTTGLTVKIRDASEAIGAARSLTLEADSVAGGATSGTQFAMIDEEGRRKILRFTYDTTTTKREIKNLQIFYQNRRRNNI